MSIQRDSYWDVSRETLSCSDLRALQWQRLQQMMPRAARSPFYRERWQQAGITGNGLRSLDDVRRLPVTTKQDLREQYPYGFLCVPHDELLRLHVSSGTTGQATAIFYSRADIEVWADLMARCMYMTGARPGDMFQNMTGYGSVHRRTGVPSRRRTTRDA